MSAKAVSLQGEGSALEAKSVGEAEQGEVVRFCLNQRVQHIILLSTFLVLSATAISRGRRWASRSRVAPPAMALLKGLWNMRGFISPTNLI